MGITRGTSVVPKRRTSLVKSAPVAHVAIVTSSGPPAYSPFANNADFVYNTVDNLSGDDDVIALGIGSATLTQPNADKAD